MRKKVLIVGSGISGLSCAAEAASLDMEVILVSPYPSERAQSVMAAGGINAALNTKGENDSIELHAEDTIRGGCFIAGGEEVLALCSDAPDIIRWLESVGTVFSKDEMGQIDLRAFGGQRNRRTAYAGASTGKQIVTALTSEVRKYECSGIVTRRVGLQFYSGLIEDGVCFGALFYDERAKALEAIYADGVVMATGGQNCLFGKTTGTLLCDGYSQGKLFSQGVTLKNLEFIQYHPTTIETPMKRMLITEGARGEGGRLFYFDGERKVYFMEDKFGERGNLMPRDVVSKCIYDAPFQVYLDITFLGKKKIMSRLSEVYELCLDYIGLDVTKEYIPVYPSVHFFMGGFDVDVHHRTNIDRLYAVGECASIYHGANRLGGNSLLAAVRGGRTAARTISRTHSMTGPKNFSAYIADQENLLKGLTGESRFPANYIRQEAADIMNDDLGITRNAEKLERGLENIDYYIALAKKLRFDTDISLYQAYSLGGMLLLSKAVLASALERRESRGAHIREDFPESREEFRACSKAVYDNGDIKITFGNGGDSK